MDADLKAEAEQHYQRGNAFDDGGHADRAIEEWQQAVQLDPDHQGALYNLGIALADAGDLDRSIEAFRKVIHLDPLELDARKELAQVLIEAMREDDAINQFRQILNLDPEDGEAARELAQLYFDRGLLEETTAALEAGNLEEEDADLWYRLGQAYERETRREDAVLAYRRTLIAQPDHREAEFALRRLHEPLEEPQDSNEIE